MTDYEDLAFKPAMTWEELCEYAKKYGGEKRNNSIVFDNCIVWKHLDKNKCRLQASNAVLAGKDNRTYEQMKNIIDNLYGED